jgi:hypothetical protein
MLSETANVQRFGWTDSKGRAVSKIYFLSSFWIRWARSSGQELANLVDVVQFGDGPDKVVWHLDSSGRYSVNSMDRALAHGTIVAYHKDFWAACDPLKIKIFLWQLVLDKLPSSLQIAVQQCPATCLPLLWWYWGCLAHFLLVLSGQILLECYPPVARVQLVFGEFCLVSRDFR